MNKIIEVQQVRQWVAFACNTCGCPDLIHDIIIVWNPRIKNRHGQAWFRSAYKKYDPKFQNMYVLELAENLWDTSTDDLKKQTSVHEACHIIDYHLNHNGTPNRRAGFKPHGIVWKNLMCRCGLKPLRCFKLEHAIGKEAAETRRQERLENRKKKRCYTLCCACREHKVTKRVFENVSLKRRNYSCTLCKNSLRLRAPLVVDSVQNRQVDIICPVRKLPKVPVHLQNLG